MTICMQSCEGGLSFHLFERRILIEVGINISHLVNWTSVRGLRLSPYAIYHPFRGYPSGCFDGLFDVLF